MKLYAFVNRLNAITPRVKGTSSAAAIFLMISSTPNSAASILSLSTVLQSSKVSHAFSTAATGLRSLTPGPSSGLTPTTFT